MHSYTMFSDGDTEKPQEKFESDPTGGRWNHIKDLDEFFTRTYRYHQRHGFFCILTQEILELIQFVFVVLFTTFLLHCVNYPVLFNDKQIHNKTTLSDVIIPSDQWLGSFTIWTWIMLLVALFVWILRLIRSIYNMFRFWDMKLFFNLALGFADSELENKTWHDVQMQLRFAQKYQNMSVQKSEFSELDVYNRILRQQNFLVAMTNKQIIPPRINIPFIGEVVYWTRGLKYNMQILLFWGPWAPFESPWKLREDYTRAGTRQQLISEFGKHVLWLSFLNFLLAPLIFVWQILYAFFSYAETFKREPGSLGMRHWSMYGRMYLRHFNELDHELQSRLCRAHRAASRYLAAFSSPLVTTIARSVAFMSGAVLAILVLLTAYDEDVITVEHVITIMTGLGACVAICRSIIPDETVAWCPEVLLANVLEHTHYLPKDWKGKAHTATIRSEFQQLFQYRIVGLVEELLSPIVTPFILWTVVYKKSADLVDFYRNFTVNVCSVGDVCSFAQMDVRKHGNPEWCQTDIAAPLQTDQYVQAEDGKLELSLIHFKYTNPEWTPAAPDLAEFVSNVERSAISLQANSVVNFDKKLSIDLNSKLPANLTESVIRGAWKAEGPLESDTNDMITSTIYLHELHHRHMMKKQEEEQRKLNERRKQLEELHLLEQQVQQPQHLEFILQPEQLQSQRQSPASEKTPLLFKN